MAQDVSDKIAERGINLGVIVQTLLLAATIGFGSRIVTSVDNLTVEVARLVTTTQVNKSEITHNTLRIDHVASELLEIKKQCERRHSDE